ncbi:MAG: hypothetical protein HN831_00270 [Waddliaceae bacterium]|nr:hypothetical protein [Waddliaceae bacterium]
MSSPSQVSGSSDIGQYYSSPYCAQPLPDSQDSISAPAPLSQPPYKPSPQGQRRIEGLRTIKEGQSFLSQSPDDGAIATQGEPDPRSTQSQCAQWQG